MTDTCIVDIFKRKSVVDMTGKTDGMDVQEKSWLRFKSALLEESRISSSSSNSSSNSFTCTSLIIKEYKIA